MNRQLSHRSAPGIILLEVILMAIMTVILIGLLLPATIKIRGTDARSWSQYNLKQLGLAMHNSAAWDNAVGKLPPLGPNFFSDKLRSSGVRPTGGLITFMENDFKVFQARLDPNLNQSLDALSYAVPESWYLQSVNGQMYIPASFEKRGTSNSIFCVEATCGAGWTKLVNGSYFLYNHHNTPDPHPTLRAPWNGNASSFYPSGCQVVMMDGSVRNVAPKQGSDFVLCSDPSNPQPPSKGW